MVPICPCKDCRDRYPGCHSKCDKYIIWKDANEANNKKIREAKNKERITFDPRLAKHIR